MFIILSIVVFSIACVLSAPVQSSELEFSPSVSESLPEVVEVSVDELDFSASESESLPVDESVTVSVDEVFTVVKFPRFAFTSPVFPVLDDRLLDKNGRPLRGAVLEARLRKLAA